MISAVKQKPQSFQSCGFSVLNELLANKVRLLGDFLLGDEQEVLCQQS